MRTLSVDPVRPQASGIRFLTGLRYDRAVSFSSKDGRVQRLSGREQGLF